jgi:hypothetical protein
MNRKLLISGIGALVIAGGALMMPTILSAQSSATEDTFIQKLAAKLGISENAVETAVTATREELHAERKAEVEAEIAQAMSNGDLTQRQADILNALADAKESLKDSIVPADKDKFANLTIEERRSQMEAKKAEMEESILNKLNEGGLNTTQEEIEAAHQAARDAGIRIMSKGHGGPGRMF